MDTAISRIGIIGGGAWGTALAIAAVRAGREVALWVREGTLARTMAETRENPDFLPGLALPEEIQIVADAKQAVEADAVLVVVPAQYLRETCRTLAPLWKAGVPAVICAKGVEEASGALMSEVAAEELPAGTPLACLSGPTFAIEVARGLPTAITLACGDSLLGRNLVDALGSRTFRPYLSPDVVGVEVGGAIKNVLAIACGVVTGRGFGDNARAALITRGLVEISRLGVAKGGLPETFMGLSGMGDLILTATSMQSRNFSLGHALGRGEGLKAILAARKGVTEGVSTAAAALALARTLEVEMPLCAAVDALLNHGAALDEVIEGLLSRPFRDELEHTSF